MNIQLDHKIQQLLVPEEVVVWTGHPNPLSYTISTGDTYLALIGVVLLVPLLGTPPTAPLTGGLFAIFLFSIFLMLIPCINYKKAKKIVFVITNKRAFELESGILLNHKNYEANCITEIELLKKIDGSHDLYFSMETKYGQYGCHSVKAGFKGIKNKEEVKKAESHLHNLKINFTGKMQA